MIRKWIVLNIGITLLIIVLVGFSMKEFACYQFNQYAHSALQFHQFRRVIGEYLIEAGLIAFLAAVLIHLIFAKKILSPLNRLLHFSKELKGDALHLDSKDEVGQIANDLKQASNRIHHLNQQQSQIMSALAHELRTPLTTLNGYLEGLEAGIFDQNKSIYDLLKKECVQLTDLVESMNELQQWENTEIKKQWMEMKRTVQSAAALFQNRFDELGVEVDMRVVSANVYCDPKAVYAILSHLFDNVVRYNVGQKVEIEGKPMDRQYVVSVSNQGSPIPKTAVAHLFDPFFRVELSRNRETGGTGLGLAIVKQIVRRLNGEVNFFSERDIHTICFSVPAFERQE